MHNGSSVLHFDECFVVPAFVLSHQESDDQGGTSADAHPAVHQHIALVQAFLHQLVAGVEVLVDISEGLVQDANFFVPDASGVLVVQLGCYCDHACNSVLFHQLQIGCGHLIAQVQAPPASAGLEYFRDVVGVVFVYLHLRHAFRRFIKIIEITSIILLIIATSFYIGGEMQVVLVFRLAQLRYILQVY